MSGGFYNIPDICECVDTEDKVDIYDVKDLDRLSELIK